MAFRMDRGLAGPVARAFCVFGLRGHVAVGRTSLVTILDDTGRLPSDVTTPDRADGVLNVGAFHRGVQNE